MTTTDIDIDTAANARVSTADVQAALARIRDGAAVLQRLADERLADYCASCGRPQPTELGERQALVFECVRSTLIDIAAATCAGAHSGEPVQ